MYLSHPVPTPSNFPDRQVMFTSSEQLRFFRIACLSGLEYCHSRFPAAEGPKCHYDSGKVHHSSTTAPGNNANAGKVYKQDFGAVKLSRQRFFTIYIVFCHIHLFVIPRVAIALSSTCNSNPNPPTWLRARSKPSPYHFHITLASTLPRSAKRTWGYFHVLPVSSFCLEQGFHKVCQIFPGGHGHVVHPIHTNESRFLSRSCANMWDPGFSTPITNLASFLPSCLSHPFV